MIVLFWIVATVLALKILWNILIAYSLGWEIAFVGKKTSRSVSLAMAIEFILLAVLIAISALIKSSNTIYAPLRVFGFGLLAISVSYAHFFVVGMIASLISKLLNKDPDS